MIGEVVSGMQPDEVEFYTSGRASNEAAWLFQLPGVNWHQQFPGLFQYVP